MDSLTIAPNAAIEFERFREFLRSECGIHLADNKQYLVATRVKQILEHNKLGSLSELLSRATISPQLRLAVVDAMTTNETYWFRDTYPFDLLRNSLLRELAESPRPGQRSIRIWSAACSSGQEPYSISMCASDAAGLKLPVEISATDISPSMLAAAREATYERMAMSRGMSDNLRERYFTKIGEELWQVNTDIRQRVSFQTLNLMHSFASLGKFDVIFCRNVLIYFDADLKRDILNRLRDSLNPGGVLVLGASEGMGSWVDMFEMINCRPGICYRRKD
ncbi:MAG: protein-glutamate O-methyltransferase CheR [Cellvibrionaceae bacterium]|nr:protein-glutamate O-methyltransferase CheR [Cellvibrionaceae bacterium]